MLIAYFSNKNQKIFLNKTLKSYFENLFFFEKSTIFSFWEHPLDYYFFTYEEEEKKTEEMTYTFNTFIKLSDLLIEIILRLVKLKIPEYDDLIISILQNLQISIVNSLKYGVNSNIKKNQEDLDRIWKQIEKNETKNFDNQENHYYTIVSECYYYNFNYLEKWCQNKYDSKVKEPKFSLLDETILKYINGSSFNKTLIEKYKFKEDVFAKIINDTKIETVKLISDTYESVSFHRDKIKMVFSFYEFEKNLRNISNRERTKLIK